MIYGARNTVGIALLTTALAFLLGATFGLLAATLGGWFDMIASRAVDVLMAIPSLIFALLVLTITGTSVSSLILVIAVLDSTRVFRLSRAVAQGIATALATLAVLSILKYRSRYKAAILLLFVAPLFVADVLMGISTLILNGLFLDIPGNLWSAILANAVCAFTYAMLIIATRLFRYNWKLDDAAMVFGAGPVRTFLEITLPNIWPALLGAFIVTFILSFNNLDISFYTLGAVPTMPSVAWGSLRFGIKPELYAIAALVNAGVLFCLALMFALMRTGKVGFGYKEGRDS